jgi:DNA transformation protein and related proteins
MSGPTAEFVTHLADTMAPLGDIRTRRMFGGVCFYCDGIAFALIADDRLFVKIDEETRRRHDEAGLPIFQPFPDKPLVLRYCAVPDDALEDGDELLDWCRPAVDVARRAAAEKARKARKRKETAAS